MTPREIIAQAFEAVAQWHDKNARLCLEISRDDPRLNADDRRRAFEAHRHHAASAAAIRNKSSDERRALIRALSAQVEKLQAERDAAREYGKQARLRENEAEDATPSIGR